MAYYDSGAIFSMISWGLCNHAGFKVSLYKGGFEMAGGMTNNFAGKLDEAKLTLHPWFEVMVSHICVLESSGYLFLLANNVFY